MRVIIKSKRQLKKMSEECHSSLNGGEVAHYIGAGTSHSTRTTWTVDGYYCISSGWHVHKRFIRKVIR